MGGNSSRSSDDSGDEYQYGQTGYRGQKPRIRINTTDLLDGISSKCTELLTVIKTMKQSQWSEDIAQNYILQELMDTKIEIDVLVGDLHRSIVLHNQIQRTREKGKTGQQHSEKKHGKAKPSKLRSQVVQLQEKLQTEESVKQLYVKHNYELTNELVKKKNILEKSENERQEVLLRLSKVTGDKLKTDNPNVTDLSDPNRPTKLGEMISELYDNEWTDAFEGLQRNGRNDRSTIRILLETFMDIFDFCCNERKKILGTFDYKSKHPQLMLSHGNTVKLKRSTSTESVPTNNPQDFVTNERRRKKNDETSKDFNKRLQDVKTEADKELQKLLKEFGEQLEPLVAQTYFESRWTNDCIKACNHTSESVCMHLG